MTFPGTPDTTTAPAPITAPGPVGIGGWLILPLLGFIGTVLLTGWNLIQAAQTWDGLMKIFAADSGSLAALKVPTALSLIAGVLILASALACLYLMFTKKRALVVVVTAHYLILAIGGITEYWSGITMEKVFPDLHDPSGLKDAIRGVVAAAIWIPYFHVSRRVRNTFTN